MNNIKNPKIRKGLSYLWFGSFICWLFMAIGIIFFDYDPGTFTYAVSTILATAYFYQLYETFSQPYNDEDSDPKAREKP